MKKQILILVLAIFAVTSAFGQNTPDPKASSAPTCVATALTPAAGEKYTYSATVTGTGYDGTTGNYTWYVTKNVNLLDPTHVANNAGEIIASGDGAYDTPNVGAATIDIIWTSAALAEAVPYYLVVKFEQANTSANPDCTAQNLKVYRIMPINTFWLKIESVADATGTAGGVEQCAADVSGAVMTEGAGTVEYTYGVNTLYVKITASGYVGNWTPSLRLAGLVNDQAIDAAGITWASGATTGTFTGATSNGTYTSATPMPSTIDGTEIIVTIPIANNHHEALADQYIEVAIDGSYVGGTTTFNDKSDVASNCADAGAFEDFVNKWIKARPGVNAVAPNTFATSPTLLP